MYRHFYLSIETMNICTFISLDNVFEQDAVFTKKLKILLDEEDSGAGNEDLLQLRSDVRLLLFCINIYYLLFH